VEAIGNKGFTVLIAEDDEELRAIIRGLLESEYRVLESSDGAIALQLARTEIPDLVISDVMMPNKGGFELCTEIKTDERTSHIAVILLTAILVSFYCCCNKKRCSMA